MGSHAVAVGHAGIKSLKSVCDCYFDGRYCFSGESGGSNQQREVIHDMTQISLDEIKRDLMVYLHRVEAGETLIVTEAGKPVAEIKPVAADFAALRPYGLCAGDFTVPDDFDAPLPESILNDFEGR